MKVKIKTLTPVHIGTGKKLGKPEFLDNHRISYDKLFELIAEEKQEEFISWIEQNPNIDVGQIQNQFKLNTKEIINKCGLYSISGSFQREVNEGIKDSSYKLFIPGSSLKGSLRTALMYKVLANSSGRSFLSKQLDALKNEAKNTRGNQKIIKELLKSSDDKIVEEIFICGFLKDKNGKTETVYDDQKYDLLKLIRIADSTSVSTNEFGEISELQVYALKKIPAHKSFRINTESIRENVEMEFDISVDIEFLKRAKEELNKQNTDFGKKYFIGIEKKLKNLFEIDIKNDTEFNEEKIVQSLLKSWVEFGEAVSNLEKEWVNSIKNKRNANINSLNKLYETKNKVKVGFGTGFSGMTILPVLLDVQTLKQKTYDFYKAVDIGLHTSNNTPLNIDEFPFTRKYSNNQNIYGGFGWVKIFTNSEKDEENSIKTSEQKTERPANTILAEIIDDKSKPPKVKILEGEHINKETILPGVRLEGLGLIKGSKVYVKLVLDRKNIQKAEYKGKAE